jgi:hypothetical protein
MSSEQLQELKAQHNRNSPPPKSFSQHAYSLSSVWWLSLCCSLESDKFPRPRHISRREETDRHDDPLSSPARDRHLVKKNLWAERLNVRSTPNHFQPPMPARRVALSSWTWARAWVWAWLGDGVGWLVCGTGTLIRVWVKRSCKFR